MCVVYRRWRAEGSRMLGMEEGDTGCCGVEKVK